nr:reverse transcriptase domain-containing protein [Tanacetum cinerariifolium]
MRTRSNFYLFNSNTTIPIRSNRRYIPNIVKPEIRTIEEIVLMADRTMEELLHAPTEGYGEAIVILEILAENFEIKTNLLQLVQANKFHDTFYNGLTEQDKDSLNAASGGNLLNKTARDALKIIENKSKISNLVEIINKQVIAPAKAVEKTNVTYGGSTAQVQPPVVPISISEPDVLRTQPKPTIPYPSMLNDQKLQEKATNQMEKFFQIFHDSHFDISFANALLLMPKFPSTIKKLTPTRMTLELADRSITRPKGVAEEVFIKVGKFHFPTDFVVIDFEADPRVPLILGRSFLRTSHALIDVFGEEITLRVNDESITFNLNQTMRYSSTYDDNSMNRVDVIDIACEDFVQDVLDFQYNPKSSSPTLVFDSLISESDSSEESKAKSFVEERPELELKGLLSHLEYDFLEGSNKFPVIMAKNLKDVEREALINILMEDDYKPAVQSQRRVNPKIHDVIKKEVIKLLDAGYFQIPIDPQDQEETTFTCPYGTFTYRRMPFGLCNAPGSLNLAADHLSRLENPHKDVLENKDINEDFPLKTLGSLSSNITPWFAGIANFHAGNFIKKGLTSQQQKKKLLKSSELAMRDLLGAIMVPISQQKSDHGTHFYNDQFTRVMIKYGVTHRLATAYHPQTSGQVEISNRGLKRILERMVGENRASWSDKLDDALWAFRTAYKTPIGCTPYKLVYGKSCHLLIELEHRAYWALKHVNFNLKTAGDYRKLQLNYLNELRDQAYENSVIYKERTKKLHDSKIKNRIFNVGDQVLLFNSCLKIFSGKLKTRWSGPFTITQVFPYGTIELSQPNGLNFKLNGHRMKHYFGGDIPSNVAPDLHTFPMDN